MISSLVHASTLLRVQGPLDDHPSGEWIKSILYLNAYGLLMGSRGAAKVPGRLKSQVLN